MSMSTSSSSSVPTPVQTPQNALLDQIAGVAEQYAQEVYQWAQNAYAHTTQLTDQVINNFLSSAGSANNFAQQNFDAYTNMGLPELRSLNQAADTYASPSFTSEQMGAAEAENAQGSEAALQNAEKDLQKYGIDPSAGRYAALDKMARVQQGAAGAAAGTMAERATRQEGLNLKAQAVAADQQLPFAGISALNTSLQGLSGAANTSLGNANTGAALLAAANPYLNTAMGLKLPPVGQTSTSQQHSSAPGPGGGSKSPPEKKDPQEPQGGQGGGAPRNPFDTGAGASRGGGGSSWPVITQPSSGGAYDTTTENPYFTGGDPYNDFSGSQGYNDALNNNSYDPNNYGDPYAGYGQDTSGSSYGDLSGYDPYNYDFGNYSDGSDASWGDTQNYTPDYSGFDTPQMPSSYDYGNEAGYDSSGYGGDYSSYDSGDGGWSYKRGGAIPEGGGRVPPSMSPSGGQRTDDIPAQINQTGGKAHLNADEFVVPRDVALWKGQEFFQTLIKKSREARMGAPARPTTG